MESCSKCNFNCQPYGGCKSLNLIQKRTGCFFETVRKSLKRAENRLLLTCHSTTVIYKTRVKSSNCKLTTLAYHRRILFTDFFPQSLFEKDFCKMYVTIYRILCLQRIASGHIYICAAVRSRPEGFLYHREFRRTFLVC